MLRVDASEVRECLAIHLTIDTPVVKVFPGNTTITLNSNKNMANFFDIRARQKEAAAAATSSKAPAQPEKNKLQPWVEK